MHVQIKFINWFAFQDILMAFSISVDESESPNVQEIFYQDFLETFRRIQVL